MVVTIDHQSLNVDPTSEDVWQFTVGGSPIYFSEPDNRKTVAAAEYKRDNAIDEAWDKYDKRNTNAELNTFEGKAALAELQRNSTALTVRNDYQGYAQAVVDDILLTEALQDAQLINRDGDRVDPNGDNEGVGVRIILGNDGPYEFDGDDTTNPDDPDNLTAQDSFTDYRTSVGTAQTEYEGVVGRGDKIMMVPSMPTTRVPH